MDSSLISVKLVDLAAHLIDFARNHTLNFVFEGVKNGYDHNKKQNVLSCSLAPLIARFSAKKSRKSRFHTHPPWFSTYLSVDCLEIIRGPKTRPHPSNGETWPETSPRLPESSHFETMLRQVIGCSGVSLDIDHSLG